MMYNKKIAFFNVCSRPEYRCGIFSFVMCRDWMPYLLYRSMTMRIQIPHAVTLMQQHQPTNDMAKLQLTKLAFLVTTTQEPSIIMTRQNDIELFISLSVPRDTMCHGFASFHERGHVQSLELLVYIVKSFKKRAGPSVA